MMGDMDVTFSFNKLVIIMATLGKLSSNGSVPGNNVPYHFHLEVYSGKPACRVVLLECTLVLTLFHAFSSCVIIWQCKLRDVSWHCFHSDTMTSATRHLFTDTRTHFTESWRRCNKLACLCLSLATSHLWSIVILFNNFMLVSVGIWGNGWPESVLISCFSCYWWAAADHPLCI